MNPCTRDMHVKPFFRLMVPLLWAVCSCTAAAGPPGQASSDAELIRRARAEQNAAIVARDFDRVASAWTASVVAVAGLGAVIHGREAYRRAFEQDARVIYRRDSEDIQVSADYPLAWEQGSWIGTDASGGAPLIRGRYSAQWVKVDGRWLIRSELFVGLECDGAACSWPVSAN